jgi:hypothetical protein
MELDEHAPVGNKASNAFPLLHYTASGECSDWITAATGIPAVSPEIGTTDPRTNTFFIRDLDVIVETVGENYPLVWATWKKIGY